MSARYLVISVRQRDGQRLPRLTARIVDRPTTAERITALENTLREVLAHAEPHTERCRQSGALSVNTVRRWYAVLGDREFTHAVAHCAVEVCSTTGTLDNPGGDWSRDERGRHFCPAHPAATSCLICGRNKGNGRAICGACATDGLRSPA